ncbi:helix-turn-helix domain-containing protein [Acutalibacter sp.]|uniref:helix-turn-helix domain-containing protein n=1 Tax=Acutalibacter sp. TaxID=1918636 RepID=UPI0021724109|nr:helix-turn-helix transcriptional regulator [Acutalibacter sp.]
MNERIKKLRKELNLTQREFAAKIGMKQNSIAIIESGRNTSDQTIMAICREFNVREEWLRSGAGDMFIQMTRDERIAAWVGETLSTESDTFQKRFISMLSKLSESDWEVLERMVEEMKKVNRHAHP